MSDPGAPPPSPYGQGTPGQNPYGEPTVQPAPPYGTPYGAPWGGPPAYDYASWFRRVGGYLVDSILAGLTSLPGIILLIIGVSVGSQDMQTVTNANGQTETIGDWNGAGTPLVIIGSVLLLAPLLFVVWNSFIRQGRTGRSIGKGVVDTKLIGEASGQPIGAGLAFVRQICHILDAICYIGYLWPLWDPKRQTFADKIMKTVVINEPKVPTIP